MIYHWRLGRENNIYSAILSTYMVTEDLNAREAVVSYMGLGRLLLSLVDLRVSAAGDVAY